MQRAVTLNLWLIFAILLVGCASPPGSSGGLATPLSPDYLSTAAALTLQPSISVVNTESGVAVQSPFPQASAAAQLTPIQTLSSGITPTHTLSVSSATPAATHTPLLVTLAPTVTSTFFPEIPGANIQIYQPGELSRVASPLKIFARLYSRVGKVVRVELYGEDGRLLGRDLTVYHTLPWQMATINMQMDFEISLPAEHGRLVISVEDRFGRQLDINTVDLILLKFGFSDITPSSSLQQAVYIIDPLPQTLIQGGTLIVSGLARPDTESTLFIELISQDGLVLGHRIAAVNTPTPGGYGSFAADVPYSVAQVTPALLVVYESGGVLSPIANLASVEVMLSP